MKVGSSQTLYIFVTSDIPNVYINTIGYCIEQFQVSEVVLLGIVKDKGQKGSVENNLGAIKDRIQAQISALQQGKYLYKNQNAKEWQEKQIEIEAHHRARYARLAGQTIKTHTIIYDKLDDEINSFLRANNHNCIFDVSAILKGFLIDVYSLLLSKSIEHIYVFELKLAFRTYDEKELIHNLSLDRGDYEFVNLSQSPHTKGTIIKTKTQEEKTRISSENYAKAVDMVAANFARYIMTIYLILVLLFYIWLAIFIIRGDWSILEPRTFVLFGVPLLGYIIGLALQIIFPQTEFSMNPKGIYTWLKNYKLKHLATEFHLEKLQD